MGKLGRTATTTVTVASIAILMVNVTSSNPERHPERGVEHCF